MQTGVKKIHYLRLLLVLLGITAFITCVKPVQVSAKELEKSPYLIKVNRVYNTVTVYTEDDNGKYTIPIKAMLCSVGTNGRTTTGTFKTKGKYRWKVLMGDVWGQYSTRIVNGILFHSVYYYGKQNPATLATREYNKLGTAASHGCIRLAVGDAKWIYDNCSVGTTVVIYDDKKSPGPLGKPVALKIASNVRWDPTDPDKHNPYQTKQPVITGVKSCKIEWGRKYSLLKGVKAASSVGTDISSDISVKGKVNTLVPGKYHITYSVTDSLKKTDVKVITVTVKNNDKAPVFKGISDKAVKDTVTVDKNYALKGVKAYCKNIKLKENLINVRIEKNNETEYDITYTASVGNGPVAVKKAKVTVDSEAPVIAGLSDFTYKDGNIPTKDDIESIISVSDNYSLSKNIEVTVWITVNSDGSCIITCEAVDEAGNVTVQQAQAKQEAVEKPAQDQTTQEQLLQDQTSKDQATQEQPAQNQTSKDQATQEQPVQDQTSQGSEKSQ